MSESANKEDRHKSSKAGAFSPNSFVSRMSEMDNSQQSIEVLSLWVQHYRSHAPRAVQTWYRYFKTADEAKKLQLLYLANDVVQNSRRRGAEFQEQFALIIVHAVQHALQGMSLKSEFAKSVKRLVKIWTDRRVFDSKIVDQLAAITGEKDKSGSKNTNSSKIADVDTNSLRYQSTDDSQQAPTNEEMLEILSWLQTVVSYNAQIQGELDALPPELTHSSKLANLKQDDLLRVRGQMEKASESLRAFSERLESESKQRRLSLAKLRAFITAQETAQRSDESRLNEHRAMLTRVSATCEELRKHVASLPDMNALLSSIQLPNVQI